MNGRFTGRHMTAILVAGFAVVVAVNLFMAVLASTTFGGVVVKNSYVASQKFNGWLEAAEQSRRLGWSVEAARREDGRVLLRLAGVPEGALAKGMARHPLGRMPDTPLRFAHSGPGLLVSETALPPDRWILRLDLSAGGERWRGEEMLR